MTLSLLLKIYIVWSNPPPLPPEKNAFKKSSLIRYLGNFGRNLGPISIKNDRNGNF